MIRRLIRLLRRIRGVSTPLGGFSFETASTDTSKDAFSLGFDLNLLHGLGLLLVSAGGKDIGAYDDQRVLLEERAARAGIKLNLPISVVGIPPNEVASLFKKLNRETRIRLQAIHESYGLSFSLGRWLAEVLSATSAAQVATPIQVDQLFSPLIARFDKVKKGASELCASSATMRDLSDLRDELAHLKKQQQVTRKQYTTISGNVLDLFKRLMDS
jgi:hypothetical protein